MNTETGTTRRLAGEEKLPVILISCHQPLGHGNSHRLELLNIRTKRQPIFIYQNTIS